MLCVSPRAVACSALLVMTAGLTTPGWSADGSDVKAKRDAAKKDFDAEFTKFKKSVRDLLDRREADARKAGDKKLVDRIKEDREDFEKSGHLRNGYPATIASQLKAARSSLDRAYTAAVKDFVRLKDDAAAAETEKEQRRFQDAVALAMGTKYPLASLKPSSVRSEKSMFTNDAPGFKIDGEVVPHSVMLHPAQDGIGTASYPVGGKATSFQVRVGIPKYRNPQPPPASPVTFEVLGDGKPLWKSDPVTALDKFQTCSVRIDGVKTLTLRVSCRDHGWAHAIWFGPTLAE